MGYAIHVVDQLAPPFQMVHEQIALAPQQGAIDVLDRVHKIIYVLGGECIHELAQVGRPSRVHVRAGDLYVVPANTPQRYIGLNPDEEASRFHAVRLTFHPQYVCLPVPSDPPLPAIDPEAYVLIADALSSYVYLPGGQDDTIRQTLAGLRDETRRREPGYRARVWALCLSLAVLTSRHIRDVKAATAAVPSDVHGLSLKDYHVAVIKDYILRHQAQPIHLNRIADHLCLSREHISRVFREKTGVTIFHYLRSCRVESAKTYLAATEKNLSEIAQLTGFSSLTVFSRTFREVVGVTASDYRRQSAGRFR